MTARGRAHAVLLSGSVASGLAAYFFFAVATQDLGATAAAPVSVLWSWWSFAGAALTFPVQHWVVQSVASRGTENRVRATLPRLAVATVVVAVVASALAWGWRDDLFGSRGATFPALVGLVALGAVVNGLARGLLMARGRTGAVGVALLGENAIRAGLAVALALGVSPGAGAYGWCLVAGYAVVLAWPSALRPRGADRGADAGDGPEALGEFLGPSSAAQLLAQAVLTGGPVLLALGGGAPAEVTALFAALALFRAPYTVAAGVVATVTGRLTRWMVDGRDDLVRQFAVRLVAATVVGVPAAAVVGGWAGPPLLRLVFGQGVDVSGSVAAVVAAGSVLALANLVATTVVLSRRRAPVLVAVWLGSVVIGAVWWAASPADPMPRAGAAFALVEAVATAVLLPMVVRRQR